MFRPTLRWATALAVAGAAVLSTGQTRLFVLMQGKKAGQAVASHKILPDGSKLVQLSMQIVGPGGNTVTLRSESTYSSKGAPVRMFHESTVSQPRARRTVTVTFNKSGASVVEEVGGKRTAKEVPLAPGAPVESKSEFWFLRDQPKPGAIDKRYRFNVSNLSWELQTSTYHGSRKIPFAGQSVVAHEVRSNLGTALVDAKGLPYRLEVGAIKLERVPPS